ncbi:spore coat protein [Marinithermofilum abyssi]|uniref:Spore coat protein n=2 Tax=Marinithermofilum abyssi TaxID=1571185 RepID=A0A8J2VEV4_9BACL|nr:spore coat protein [Marinithermofilum abyssi]
MEHQMPVMHQLAWHETLDMHELVTLQAAGLIKLKKSVRKVKDPQLRNLYVYSIQALENNLRELLAFYPAAPRVAEDSEVKDSGGVALYAGDLLGLTKTAVRNYAIAITETATPMLRQVLTKQLMMVVHLHGMIFYYMLQRSMYPAYDLNQLLAGDVRHATRALSLPY